MGDVDRFEEVCEEFPEMCVPEVREEVVRVAVAYAVHLGDASMAENPDFLRLVYMAGAPKARSWTGLLGKLLGS